MGNHVGASDRALSRAFIAEIGLPFGRWRTMLDFDWYLSPGESIRLRLKECWLGVVQCLCCAFRKETGVTPSAYFRSQPSTVNYIPASVPIHDGGAWRARRALTCLRAWLPPRRAEPLTLLRTGPGVQSAGR